MSRRLVVGPRADLSARRWPVMLLDSEHPGSIRGGFNVASRRDLDALAALQHAECSISDAAHRQMDDTGVHLDIAVACPQ